MIIKVITKMKATLKNDNESFSQKQTDTDAAHTLHQNKMNKLVKEDASLQQLLLSTKKIYDANRLKNQQDTEALINELHEQSILNAPLLAANDTRAALTVQINEEMNSIMKLQQLLMRLMTTNDLQEEEKVQEKHRYQSDSSQKTIEASREIIKNFLESGISGSADIEELRKRLQIAVVDNNIMHDHPNDQENVLFKTQCAELQQKISDHEEKKKELEKKLFSTLAVFCTGSQKKLDSQTKNETLLIKLMNFSDSKNAALIEESMKKSIELKAAIEQSRNELCTKIQEYSELKHTHDTDKQRQSKKINNLVHLHNELKTGHSVNDQHLKEYISIRVGAFELVQKINEGANNMKTYTPIIVALNPPKHLVMIPATQSLSDYVDKTVTEFEPLRVKLDTMIRSMTDNQKHLETLKEKTRLWKQNIRLSSGQTLSNTANQFKTRGNTLEFELLEVQKEADKYAILEKDCLQKLTELATTISKVTEQLRKQKDTVF